MHATIKTEVNGRPCCILQPKTEGTAPLVELPKPKNLRVKVKSDRFGKCVKCTATLATREEWFEDKAKMGMLQKYKNLFKSGKCKGGLIVRQKGNGSVRLVSEIGRHGGGKAKPFVMPSPFPFHAALTDHTGYEKERRASLASVANRW
jgi:hypothetical protein